MCNVQMLLDAAKNAGFEFAPAPKWKTEYITESAEFYSLHVGDFLLRLSIYAESTTISLMIIRGNGYNEGVAVWNVDGHPRTERAKQLALCAMQLYISQKCFAAIDALNSIRSCDPDIFLDSRLQDELAKTVETAKYIR